MSILNQKGKNTIIKKNYKVFIKEIEENNKFKKMIVHVHWLEQLVSLKYLYYQNQYTFNVVSFKIQNSNDIFYSNRKKIQNHSLQRSISEEKARK